MIMNRTYDIVVIGGGPNGLLSAGYLAKAGLKVLVLERRHEMGGGAATEELTGTARLRVNAHAFFMMMVDYAPAYQDLELETRHGLTHLYPEVQCVMPFADGRAACLYSDVEKTCSSFAQFSQKDADAYREFTKISEHFMKEFLGPATYAQPMAALDQVLKLEQTDVGKQMNEYNTKSPKTIIEEWFESPQVKALMMHNVCMWGLDPYQDGLGYLVPLYVDRMYRYRMLRGGTHTLAQALMKVVMENGGKLMTSVIPTKIVVEDGVARGVQLEDGRFFEATKGVISTIDTHQTFLELIDKENLDEDFAESIEGWQWEHWGLLGTHLSLADPPRLKIAESDPELGKALYYVVGHETAEEFLEHYDRIGEGKCGLDDGFIAVMPTIHDPLQIPKNGGHVLTMWKMAPYDLDGDSENWYSLKKKEEHAQGFIEVMGKYATNITDENIRNIYVSTPAEYSMKFMDMKRGSIKQGAYLPLQMGYMRPNEFCSKHRSPIKGLYMGGACTYPGGTILLANGYLAADAVADELGLDRWWEEPEIVKNAREKGLL
jgi:phytoene dehydrogenase-like protein